MNLNITRLKCCILIMLSLLVIPNLSNGEDIIDGYAWEKLPETLKVIIVKSYIDGYSVGKLLGAADGATQTVEVLKVNINSDIFSDKDKEHFRFTVSFIEKNYSASIMKTYSNINKLDKSIEYYVREMDSFLKTYPLCKRNNLFSGLLPSLTLVWEGSIKSYKEKGENCLKSN